MRDYFDKLRDTQGIVLSPEQQAWYVKKAGTQLSRYETRIPLHAAKRRSRHRLREPTTPTS